MTSFIPLSNRVLVRPDPAQEKTSSGLFLPMHANPQVEQGTALAVGLGAVTMSGDVIPMEVKAGYRVVFSRMAGVEIEVEGETFLLFHETDLFGIIPS